jgi:hypothetical protein
MAVKAWLGLARQGTRQKKGLAAMRAPFAHPAFRSTQASSCAWASATVIGAHGSPLKPPFARLGLFARRTQHFSVHGAVSVAISNHVTCPASAERSR